jgi:ubiquitin-conjugating enzyme E2 Q
VNDFGISVSIPVITLAKSIPPRALMAWDRRLLSRTQHLVLFIYDYHGTYPIIGPDGQYTEDATRLGITVQFKVGLSGRYKPNMSEAKKAVMTFGLIKQDSMDLEELMTPEYPQSMKEEKERPEEDVDDIGRFDDFSLSSSLESLMNHMLLRVIQLRRQFNLGWAGAEMLFLEAEKLQKRAEDTFKSIKSV